MNTIFTTDRVKALQKRSADAIGIFKTTITNLSQANKEVRMEKARKLEEIAARQKDVEILEGIESQNETFIGKINEFLGTNQNEQ